MSNQIINTTFNRPALKRDTVTPVQDVAGANPPKLNLKDHPEINGYTLIVNRVSLREGDSKMGPWILCDAYIVPPTVDIFSLEPTEQEQYLYTFMSGAENVLDRVMKAASIQALPMSGTLRNEGQAWFLD